MATDKTRWIARLTPITGRSVNDLLRVPLPMDVWEREEDALLVAASETQLSELERRHLARVDRLSTVSEYEERARRRSRSSPR